MATAAASTAIGQSHISTVVEVARAILERRCDEHLAKKTLLVQGFLEMSQRYPERDYHASLNRALADLTAAIHLHLNAELHAATTLLARLGEAAQSQDNQKA